MADKYFDKSASSALFATNYAYVEELYEQYLVDKSSVSDYWQQYFASLGSDVSSYSQHEKTIKKFTDLSSSPVYTASGPAAVASGNEGTFIAAYRDFAHKYADINPLFKSDNVAKELCFSSHGFSGVDDKLINSTNYKNINNVGDLISSLQRSYCEHVSIETSHISDNAERQWLYKKLETPSPYALDSAAEKKSILENLSRAEGIEQYFAIKYVGQKRFSLEGGESLIPCLRFGMEYAAKEYGVTDVVLGMAHRGRLNVMLNVLAMPTEEIFKEFEGRADYGNTSGDVKYHLGYSSDLPVGDKYLHTSLMFNPSHLEFIAPVVNGSVRARQDSLDDGVSKSTVLPIIIHGDSAMAGQGVVAETFNMSKTSAFDVGGSIHIVINNQVGFTAQKHDSMSSEYCSSIAKSINAPIFHVNGDDPEAVVACIRHALDYRETFAKDIVIDIVCYRRMGHNEADEPAATLPMMYTKIKTHPTTRLLYANKLIELGVITAADASKMQADVKSAMDKGQALIAGEHHNKTKQRQVKWGKYIDKHWNQVLDTGMPLNKLKSYAAILVSTPNGFKLQRQVGTMISQRQKMGYGELALNWGMAELMAYTSLLDLGFSIRIVGQDSKRGTFSHRHTVLFDQDNGAEFNPLTKVNNGKNFYIYDSVLSETAPLGFEYGYSITDPRCLNIWEAQFGDFANGAQVIIDQFISSGWQKWKRLSGLVMLLPHGYEGMGPEHSSARLERFLQLSAQFNIQVCVPSTPSQMFHLLLRQMLRDYRKPLIVMTPKSLLRHHGAVSSLEDLKKGRFETVIPDPKIKMSQAKRLVLCSGKVYYDLIAKRAEVGLDDVAIIRLEQLYPFPTEVLSVMLSRHTKSKSFIWCQEEPKNQGAWFIMKSSIERCLPEGASLVYAGREFSAAPAAGYPSLHKKQQQDLVDQALGLLPNSHEGKNDS